MKTKMKLFLFSGIAGSYGLFNPVNALAACTPAVGNDVSITCDGIINTQQSFTDASGITATIIPRTQITLTEQDTPAFYFNTSSSRLQNQGNITTDAITSDGVALETLSAFTLINDASIGALLNKSDFG